MTTAIDTARRRTIDTAWRVGLPPDQLQNFLSAGYVPFPKQMEFHAACREADAHGGPDQIGYGGARGPGKSHATFAQVALDDARRFPGLKILYLRKVAKQAREQFEDLRRSVLRFVPHNYRAHVGTITLWNDSRIFLGHFRTESEIDNYLGMEYDVIVIEEATTLTLSKYRALRDSNRSSKPGVRPRIYATTNPGGVGHAWFRSTFIEPWRADAQTFTRFIPGTVDDNPMIDPGYRRKLEENTGWKLRAYRYGDWDIAAGQFFTTFRHDLHVRKAFTIPEHWQVWLAMDYGFVHPTVIYLFAKDDDGMVYVVDEHSAAGWLPPRHAAAVRAMLERNNVNPSRIRKFVAGLDVFANKGDARAYTIADQYREEGFRLTKADADRINGAGEILKRLGDPEQGQPVRVQIFDRCVGLIEQLPYMEHDPHRPEDVLKVDVDEDGNGGDDCYDAFRYGIMADKQTSMHSGRVNFYA